MCDNNNNIKYDYIIFWFYIYIDYSIYILFTHQSFSIISKLNIQNINLSNNLIILGLIKQDELHYH